MNKLCPKCGNEYPLTPEYWHRDSKQLDGLTTRCKVCRTERYHKMAAERKAEKAAMPPPTHRKCAGCGNEYPLTPEYWVRNKSRIGGVSSPCKACTNKRRREYEQTEKGRDIARQNRRKKEAKRAEKNAQINPYEDQTRLKTCNSCNISLSVTEFSRDRTSPDGLEYACKACKKAQKNAYKSKNPEKFRIVSMRNQKRWQKENYERYRNNQRTHETRRRTRKRDAVFDFTKEDWQYALDYFNGCCAFCGRQAKDLFGERKMAVDHFIPLSKGGATIPENIIPLCHGIDGCNSKKHTTAPKEYLERTYGKRKAKEILARIETFFTTVRKTSYQDAA